VPPFGGFFGKYLVIAAAVENGQWGIALTFVVGAFLTILYLFRLFTRVFLGESKGIPAKEASRPMVYCVVLLAVLSLAGGILINFPFNFLQTTLAGLPGVAR
jgi:NADH:ubiquinone oxidoreductase subunit 2 (subunit N)